MPEGFYQPPKPTIGKDGHPKITSRVDRDTFRILAAYSQERQLSLSEIMRLAVVEFVANRIRIPPDIPSDQYVTPEPYAAPILHRARKYNGNGRQADRPTRLAKVKGKGEAVRFGDSPSKSGS